MKFLTILLLALTAATTALASDLKPIIAKTALGCQSRDDLGKYVRFLVDKDEALAKQFIASKFMTNECRVLEEGTEVNITDTAIFSGLVQVRPQGEMDSWWTNIERVKQR